MDDMLPGHFQRFTRSHPELYRAFEELGRLAHESGPLSERERRLVKLGIAIGSWTEGGVHSAVRHALAAGCTAEDVAHTVRLAITTVGWPRAQAAMTWVGDVLEESAARRGKGRARSTNGRPLARKLRPRARP
jgi:4-carboxymuconolactone decarboxylase